jgi:hypothetical protein
MQMQLHTDETNPPLTLPIIPITPVVVVVVIWLLLFSPRNNNLCIRQTKTTEGRSDKQQQKTQMMVYDGDPLFLKPS